VASFESYIFGDFLEKNPMIDIFCKYSSGGEAFQQLVEEQLEEVEFAEVRCRDVYQLRHFEQALQREGHEEQERRMIRLFSKIFEHHLRTNKILLTQKNTQERKLRQQEYPCPHLG
jgi:putative NIF3 family GTP cyclohydrolase 1 type 2